MPRDTTPADIADAYLEGWRLGLKALAVYRDGSKESQPLSTSTEGDKAAAKQAAVPRRERLPDTRQSITHKFSIAGHEGYITVGLYEDGRPGELFITMAKEGSTIGGLMDCFGTAVSMSLQYGVPLEVYVNKFSHTRFEPMGHTKNPDIRIAKSIVDYIFRWLGITFLPGYREANANVAQSEDGRPCRGGCRPARPGPPPGWPAGWQRATDCRRPRKPPPPAMPKRPPPRPMVTPACLSRTGMKTATGMATATASRRPWCWRVALEIDFGGRVRDAQRAVCQLPDRCALLRQLRRDHGPQRQLLSLPQLRQQHGLLVTDFSGHWSAGDPSAWRAPL